MPVRPAVRSPPCLQASWRGKRVAWPWAYRLSRRSDPHGGTDLPELYDDHCRSLGLGDPDDGRAPLGAYNLLFDDDWFLSVLRVQGALRRASVSMRLVSRVFCSVPIPPIRPG